MPPALRRRPVPTISGDGFRGSTSLTLIQLRGLEVNSVADTAQTILSKTNWDGGVIATLSINLSNDNLRVHSASFNLLGRLYPDSKSFPAHKFFKIDDSSITLSIKIDDSSYFSFKEGLTSELVDGANIEHSFKRNGEDIEDEELEELGISGFCLRMFCMPSAQDWIKFNLTLIPRPLADIQESTNNLVNSPLFPCLSLATGDIPLKPLTQELLQVRWGFPILPAIIPGVPMSTSNNCPCSTDIRATLSAVLRHVNRPEIKLNVDYWEARMNEICKDGEASLKEMPLELVWPLPSPVIAQVEGRKDCLPPSLLFFFFYKFYFIN